jgi:Coenzyme PQQ synthesis protein D (PqqD)
MLPSDARLKLDEDVTYQDMGEGQPAVIMQLSTGQLFTCNETTRVFLDHLDGKRTFLEVIEKVLAVFDVDRNKLMSDLSALAEKLIKAGLIQQL